MAFGCFELELPVDNGILYSMETILSLVSVIFNWSSLFYLEIGILLVYFKIVCYLIPAGVYFRIQNVAATFSKPSTLHSA